MCIFIFEYEKIIRFAGMFFLNKTRFAQKICVTIHYITSCTNSGKLCRKLVLKTLYLFTLIVSFLGEVYYYVQSTFTQP